MVIQLPIILKSNKLTGEMKAAVKKIPKGGSLTFTGIEVIKTLRNQKKKTRLERNHFKINLKVMKTYIFFH